MNAFIPANSIDESHGPSQVLRLDGSWYPQVGSSRKAWTVRARPNPRLVIGLYQEVDAFFGDVIDGDAALNLFFYPLQI